MKIAPIVWAMNKYNENAGQESPRYDYRIVHTGQHYDENMSGVFFAELHIPQPHIHLGVGSGSHAAQTARVMLEYEKVLDSERPDAVIVVGDVNSTLACAITTAKCYWKKHNPSGRNHPLLCHVEAGLRSGDRSMPEEINRIVTDALSEQLFVTERSAIENLMHEGVPSDQVHYVGHVMVDTLLALKERTLSGDTLGKLGLRHDGQVKAYGVVTLHRPSNVDDRATLENVLRKLAEAAEELSLIFPIHPRTRDSIKKHGYDRYFIGTDPTNKHKPNKGLQGIDPLGYLEFLELMSHAKVAITDSGGIQEETTALGIPCFTIRDNTERPVTVTEGTNILVGQNCAGLTRRIHEVLLGKGKVGRRPYLWDGRSAERIVAILANTLAGKGV